MSGDPLLPGHKRDTNAFDLLRLIAAYTVLLSHSFPLSGLPEPTPGPYSLGTLAVFVFFGISGYLITQSWENDPNLRRFFWRRCLRIFPALIVVVSLCGLVLGPLVTTQPLDAYFANPIFHVYFFNILLSMRAALPGVFESLPYPDYVNGPLWTLRFEFVMYVAVAVLGVAGCIRRPRLLLTATLLSGGAWMAWIWLGGDLLRHSAHSQRLDQIVKLLELAPPFLFGAVLYRFRTSMTLSNTAALVMVVVIACCALLKLDDVVRSVAWIVVPYTVCALALRPPRLLVTRPLDSDISYGVYIYAWPVQQLFALYALDNWGWLACLCATTATTTLLAWLSWHLVERRALALKPRTPRPITPQASPEGTAAVADAPESHAARP